MIEERLLEENREYQSTISNCEKKINERLQEAELLQNKLQEFDLIEKSLKSEVLSAKSSIARSESSESGKKIQEDADASKLELIEKLENKKIEMGSVEKIVQELEVKWQQVQVNALKQPSPGQREKALDKQLHSLIEQLASKQAQAEGLSNEIHLHEMELEKLNGMWRRIESSSWDLSNTRNRFARSSSNIPVHSGGKSESLENLTLLSVWTYIRVTNYLACYVSQIGWNIWYAKKCRDYDVWKMELYPASRYGKSQRAFTNLYGQFGRVG